MKSDVTPVAICSFLFNWEWVVDAGCITNDFESPILAKWDNKLTLSINFLPSSNPPFIAKPTNAPYPPFRYFLASLWEESDSRPG